MTKMYSHKESEQFRNRAENIILGGVNSPSRSYKAVGGGAPVVMEKAQGAYFYDIDGNKYIDIVKVSTLCLLLRYRCIYRLLSSLWPNYYRSRTPTHS